MKYLGKITDNKDLVTKEYVDGKAGVTGVKGNSETNYRTGNVNLTAANIGAAASSHTHNYAGSDSAGGPANSLKGFTNTTTTATAVDSATQNGHVYVNGTTGIYNISDGACFVHAYSSSWVAQIYQDYRTGQIALRGKNSGTWQSWRKVLDDTNWSSFVTKSALGLGNVENKSSATIRSELTSANVTTALGYTPPQQDTNTHRPIQMNGSQILGDNTTALNLKAGSNVTLSNSSGTVTFAATDTTYESKAAASGGTAVSLCTTGEKYTWNNKSNLALGTTSSTAYRGDYGNTAYSHATDSGRLTTATSSGLYKVASTAQGHVASLTAVVKADITALGIPAQDTTYESKAAASGGTAVSLCTTGEKYTWNNKQNALSAMTASEASTGTATTARSITAKVLSDLINDRITAAITNAIGGSY